VVIDNPPSQGTVAARFDQASIAAQIKWAQANPPDYSYKAFCKVDWADLTPQGQILARRRPAKPCVRLRFPYIPPLPKALVGG
jgi:hypothetical protein